MAEKSFGNSRKEGTFFFFCGGRIEARKPKVEAGNYEGEDGKAK